MKRKIFPCFLLLFFLFMMVRPDETFKGASEGLLLWFQIVLPTLLPFLIITNLLLATNTIRYITNITAPLLSPFFQTSPEGTFAIISGFLCGYPMGAKVTSDLLKSRKIQRKEAAYLLSFCNNTSPMFIMNYVVLTKLGKESLLIPSLGILFFVPVFLSFFFRRFYFRNAKAPTRSTTSYENGNPSVSFHFDMLDQTMMNSFETITKVGGYIILFSVLLTLLQSLPVNSAAWNLVILPSLEVTNGVSLLAARRLPIPILYALTMALVSFGGICSIAQTQCMLAGTGLSVVPYIIEKLITAIVTSLFALCYTQCIYYY